MAKPLIVALSGKAGVGKSTCALMLHNYLKQKNIPSMCVSFAGPLREECRQTFPNIDFYTKPTPDPVRKLLQAWGQLRRIGDPHYWINAIADRITDYPHVVIIDDLRFSNEARWLCIEHDCILIRLSIAGNNPLAVPQDVSEVDLDDWDDWDDE